MFNKTTRYISKNTESPKLSKNSLWSQTLLYQGGST